MENKIRILLVEDHDVVRDGLKALLVSQPDFAIVGAIGSGEEALALLETVSVDVILMDITLQGMDGLETTRRIKACHEDARVLALTIHEGQEYFFAMLQAGAVGYLPKRAASEDLIQAIRVVAEGNVYLHHSVAGALVTGILQSQPSQPEAAPSALATLTAREREVLVLIGEGLRNKDIGERLGISPKTVSRHRDNILRKLNLETRAELIRYALESGLAD